MVLCPQGHQYDDGRYSRCPYCGLPLGGTGARRRARRLFGRQREEEQRTLPGPAAPQQEELTQRRAAAADDVKTVGVFARAGAGRPVVGWLVCVQGPGCGRDHRLYAGRNRIGRSAKMDVVLSEDADVRLDMHAELVYDPASVRFMLVDGEGPLTCNDQPVHGYVPLADGDTIAIGGSRLVFVAFCREGRTWQ